MGQKKENTHKKGIVRVAEILLAILTIYAIIQSKFDSASDVIRGFIFIVFAIFIITILERIYAEKSGLFFSFLSYFFSVLLISIVVMSFYAIIFNPIILSNFKKEYLNPALGIEPIELIKTKLVKGKVKCQNIGRPGVIFTHEKLSGIYISDSKGEFAFTVKGKGVESLLINYAIGNFAPRNKNIIIDFNSDTTIVIN